MAKSALWLELGSAGWVAIYVLLAPWLGLLLPIVNTAIYPCMCHVAHGTGALVSSRGWLLASVCAFSACMCVCVCVCVCVCATCVHACLYVSVRVCVCVCAVCVRTHVCVSVCWSGCVCVCRVCAWVWVSVCSTTFDRSADHVQCNCCGVGVPWK